MQVPRDVLNGLQLSAIVEVVARAGAEIAGNDISDQVLGLSFTEGDPTSLIAARIKKQLVTHGIGV